MAFTPYYPNAPYYPGMPMPQMPTNPVQQTSQFTDTSGMIRNAQQPAVSLQGRTVGNISEVTAQDVPMNGTAALFPLSDGTAIFSRSWQPDGTVRTVEYRPVQSDQEEQPMVDLLSMQNDISNIKDMLENMQKPATKTTRRKATDEPAD